MDEASDASDNSFTAMCLAPDAVDGDCEDEKALPVDGHEYLRRVMREAKQYQCVQEAKDAERLLQPLTNERKDEVSKEKALQSKEPSSSLEPSSEWQRWQLRHFSHLRLRMERHVQLMEEKAKSGKNTKHKFPKKDDEKGWCVYCHGSSLWQRLEEEPESQVESESTVKEPQLESESDSAHQPLTSILVQLKPTLVNDLVDMHVEWAETLNGLTSNMAMWLFALMIRLEKPLVPETQSSLRSLAKLCRRQRSTITSTQEEKDNDQKEEIAVRVRELSLMVCLVAKYFGQTDLADD